MRDSRLDLVYQLMHQKAATARAYVQYMDTEHEYTEGDQLYMREAHFVMAIGPGEGRTMSEIAQIMNVTQGAVSQTAARLEKKGYIRREKNAANRRQIIALLTEKGERFYAEHEKYDERTFAHLDEVYLHRFRDEELQMLIDYEAAIQKMLCDGRSD